MCFPPPNENGGLPAWGGIQETASEDRQGAITKEGAGYGVFPSSKLVSTRKSAPRDIQLEILNSQPKPASRGGRD